MNKEAIDALIAKTPKLAGARAKLEAMAPGNYCLHRSWGFGKIVDFDEAAAKIIIDFEEGKTGHAMAVAFCVDKLDVLKPNRCAGAFPHRAGRDRGDDQEAAGRILICDILATERRSRAMMASEIERVLSLV